MATKFPLVNDINVEWRMGMNIFEYAMKMESDGREYYLANADKTSVPALKKIWIDLADDELKHYNIFKAMRDGLTPEYKEAEKTHILKTVKNVFEELKTKDEEYSFDDEVKKAWEHARDIEKEAEDFYRDKANELDSDAQKELLNRIADEEHRHWVTMNNVLQFLDRPKHWLEDAEWSNLEDY